MESFSAMIAALAESALIIRCADINDAVNDLIVLC
jgi:hypothetical protein